MNLIGKQLTYRKRREMSSGINEGIRALAEGYQGNIELAKDHCLHRIPELMEGRLDRIRSSNPPSYTHDGGSYLSLVWVLLVDGMQPYRPTSLVRAWFTQVINATDVLEAPFDDQNLPQLVAIFNQSLNFAEHVTTPTVEHIQHVLCEICSPQPTIPETQIDFLSSLSNALLIDREFKQQPVSEMFGQHMPSFLAMKADQHAIALVKGDRLSNEEIAVLHQNFYRYLYQWRPASPFKRLYCKQGLLCVVFRDGCTQETIDFILTQRTTTEEHRLVLADGARVVSWVIDLPTRSVHGHEVLLPSWLPMSAHFQPGKAWLQNYVMKWHL